MLSNRYPVALEWTERALAIAGPRRLTEVVADALNTRGVLLQEAGRLDEALLLIRAAIQLAADNHHSHAELRARYNLAGRVYADAPRAASEVIHGAVEVATRTGRRDWQALAATFAAVIDEGVGEWDRALRALDALSEVVDPSALETDAIAVRASIEARRGDRAAWPAAARRIAEKLEGASNTQWIGVSTTYATELAIAEGRLRDAIVEASRVDSGNWLYFVTELRARAALRLGDLAEARAAAAVPALGAEVGRLRDLERRAIEGGIAALEGRRDEAVALLQEATRGIRALDVPLLLADRLLDAIYVLGPDDPAVPAMADEARAIYERLGARVLLDRLDEALAGDARGAAVPTADANARRTPSAGTGARTEG
jgi:tetratricopeptide (TPR) repeat protein